MLSFLCNDPIIWSEAENEALNARVFQFATKMKDSITYCIENRRSNKDTIEIGYRYSKKAEYAAARWLHEKGDYPFLEPDMEVVSAENKNWDPDLIYDPLDKDSSGFHVKSCSCDTRFIAYDYSWTFQTANSNGPGGKDAIFYSKKDEWVILVYATTWTINKYVIMGLVDFQEVKSVLCDPNKDSLVGLRLCLNYENIRKLGAEVLS